MSEETYLVPMKTPTLKAAMVSAVEVARSKNATCYVFAYHTYYRVSYVYQKNWLFRAYPGGRRQLSLLGTSVFEKENPTRKN